jgi:hypothetical protein
MEPMQQQVTSKTIGSSTIMKILFGALVFSIFIAIGSVYSFYRTLQSGSPIRNTEIVSPVVTRKVQESNVSYFEKRDYLGAIQDLKEVEKSIQHDDVASKAKIELTLASQLLRVNQIEAFAKYISIYKNATYSVDVRSQALFELMWHIGAHSGKGDIVTPDIVNTYILGPESLSELAPKEGKVSTSRGIERLAARGMKRSFDLNPTLGAGMGYAKLLRANFPENREDWDVNESYVQEMKSAYERALPLFESTVEDLTKNPRFDPSVTYGVNAMFIGPQFFLTLLGQLPASDLYKTGDLFLTYLNYFPSKHFVRGIYLSSVSQRYICAIGLIEKRPLSVDMKNKVRELLGNMYALPEEDVERRYQIRGLGSQQKALCYEPMVYMANEVDPELKDFLVNKIGGWSNEQFNK